MQLIASLLLFFLVKSSTATFDSKKREKELNTEDEGSMINVEDSILRCSRLSSQCWQQEVNVLLTGTNV